jgi:hypothetical protein
VQHLSLSLPARRTGGRLVTTRTLLLIALVLVIALLGPVGSAAASVAGPADPRRTRPAKVTEDPLLVHLDSISPGTLSDNVDEPITITGTLTNRSGEQWSDINLYAFISPAPIVDATNLAISAGAEDDAFVGERIVTPGTEDNVAVLDPGQSSDFSLTVPRSELLVTAAGVYWLGVHASGLSPTLPRDAFADGRARTFIPLVPGTGGKNPDTVDAAVVVPIRETVWLTPDGRVDRVGRWARSLDVGGRLHSILDAGDPTTGVPLTWLVDPAVPAAVARLAAGNPARSLTPDPDAVPVEPTEEPTEEPETPTEGAPAGPEPFAASPDPIPPVDPEQELTEEEQRVADLAQAWLDRFRVVTSGQTVLALPYGDLDVSADAANGARYYQQAVTRSSQVMAWLQVAASPALAPRDGHLSRAAIEGATPDTTILMADTSFAVPPNAPASMVRLLGHKVVVTSSGAAAGGPSPTAADDPLALRQRLLSEAALRLQSGSRSPVVVMLPADWRPTDPSKLFSGLDVPWLDPVTVADLSLRPAASMNGDVLAYTEEDAEAELDVANFSAADDLTGRADLLAGVLTLQNLVRQQVADEVLMSLSSGHRINTFRAADSVRAAAGFISDQLASVTVDAPGALTLSSDSGKFGADVVNGLDQPVTVRIAVQSDGSLDLQDLGPLPLSAAARFRILPRVTANRPGIHQVRLVVTDAQGTPLGDSTNLQIRAAQVSGLIWLLLAGGALLLFGTIAIRLVRRIRGRGTATGEQVG